MDESGQIFGCPCGGQRVFFLNYTNFCVKIEMLWGLGFI